MRKLVAVASVVAVAAALSACMMNGQSANAASMPSAAEQQQLGKKVEAYFRKAANLPSDVTLELSSVKASPVPGLLSAELKASRGKRSQMVPLLISRDGRYIIQGKLIDMSVDPLKAVMDKIKIAGEPMRGNPNAKVTIVEFSDFECPFCGRAYKTIEDDVMKNYGDKVRLVYKFFPLTNIHPWAESGALAAACAREQSPKAFWKMYNFLFSNQQMLKPSNVKQQAADEMKKGGFDVAKFNKCFDNKTAQPLIAADQKEAESLGVRSTPTFFINGHKLEGAQPYEAFKKVIEEALQEANKPKA